MDSNKRSNPNILEENVINTKKSLSVNKTNKKFGNMTIYNNFSNVKLISLSQGKTNQKNNNNHNSNHNNIKNSTQNSFNIKKINIYGSNYISNNSNSNLVGNNLKNMNNFNNDMLAFANTNIDGYKTFFNINKSKDKYNFKINQGYIKEEGKKYANQNININNNVIDENEEYLESTQKKKSISKEHKKNGQLLIKYSEYYKFNNFNNFNNKNGGYGTFYKYNMKNTNFGGFNKKKNSSQLPQLFKMNNNGNGSNPKNKYNIKNKFKYY